MLVHQRVIWNIKKHIFVQQKAFESNVNFRMAVTKRVAQNATWSATFWGSVVVGKQNNFGRLSLNLTSMIVTHFSHHYCCPAFIYSRHIAIFSQSPKNINAKHDYMILYISLECIIGNYISFFTDTHHISQLSATFHRTGVAARYVVQLLNPMVAPTPPTLWFIALIVSIVSSI